MTSLKLKIFLLISAALILPRSVYSHDGWVEISPSIVEKNQSATIALIQGNHSNEHKSYRIAGKWDQKYTTLVVVDPKAKQNSLTDRLIDFGEDAEAVGPKGPKGFYLASFVPKDEGFYLVLARQARTLQQGDGPKLVTVRIAKSAFAAFSVPTVAAARSLKGFDHIIAGDDAVEIHSDHQSFGDCCRRRGDFRAASPRENSALAKPSRCRAPHRRPGLGARAHDRRKRQSDLHGRSRGLLSRAREDRRRNSPT